MWIFILIITLEILFCLDANCTILRLPCKQYAHFNITRDGFALAGFVINSIEGLNDMECRLECILNDQCKSINIEKGDRTCELNSKTVIEITGGYNALIKKPNWIYKSTDYNNTLIGQNCLTQKPCTPGEICMDLCTCPGYECLPGLKDCQEARNSGYKANGVYKISNTKFPSQWLPVFCDMTTDGSGWIVFQRRIDNSVDFFRNWNEYKKGFGVITGNYWMGLDNLHILAAQGKGAVLRVDLKHRDDSSKVYAYYNKFEIANETDGYRLTIGGYSGNASDSLGQHDLMQFSTKDRDNDVYKNNCAVKYEGGWWYKDCHNSNLNGLYPNNIKSSDAKYMSWFQLKASYGNIMFSEMKLRLK